ncbi:selective LIM binding factor [Tritrichomonas foetus]|uniref:Selective LIM binding factor n=1 Tax=Tritrichomonas foetus TaxID=1144522 RepID=A0A1J4KPZ2_9EUKA|nr:selective LIM binding factor [Tritrichomonas foetus]|eukprot:OHT11766.1 selective LIM binding factor [Tritrichomonas foetus]
MTVYQLKITILQASKKRDLRLLLQSLKMKFDVSPPIIPAPNTSEKRIVCAVWSPDGERIAVATADHCVTLIKSSNNETTRFPIKARDENASRIFTITGLAWAPDSCRFAVSQSDMAVAVYDVGPANATDARKKITLRFSHKSPVLCVAWPVTSSTDFVYGMGDGAVMCGLTKMKKSEELYRHGCAPVSITTTPRMNSVAVGHLDGNVFVVNLDTRSRLIALQTAVPPMALAWGTHICAAGADLQISFADSNGGSNSHVDFSNQADLRSFTAASFDPSGQTAIVAARNSLLTFTYSPRLQSWQQQARLVFDGLYSVPSISWSPDGSKIAVGSVTGGLYIVTASIGSFRYKNLFEVVHVTGSQIRVVDLQSHNELSIRSDFRILTTNFQQNRYVIVRTTQSFVVADTKSGKTSEFPASLTDGDAKITERFIFIDDVAVLVWNTGELTVVEMGKPQPLAAISTQYASPYLLSLRFNAKIGRNGNSKILAYLVDSKTVRIVDVETLMSIGSVQIANKIDWLELNVSGSMLLFRDSKRSLYVFNLATQSLSGLLGTCSYAQWTPDANVVVAQSKKQLYVWYSPTSPDEVRVFDIEGEVVDIRRSGTKTSVTINSNGKNTSFPLDGAFIAFSASMEANNLNEAAKILLTLENQDNFRSLWGELANAAMNAHDYTIAEVSYSNLGDLSRARFLHKLNKLIAANGISNCQVQSRIAMLQSNFKQAEYCLIEHDQLDTAIDMYKSMHMWNELLDLADLRCPTKAPQLRDEYFTHLLETGQYQVAARLKARRGEISEAIDLCLQGDKPQLAADILLNGSGNVNPQLLTHVAEALNKSNRFDIAGQVYERLGRPKDALEAYRKGHSYYRALELAKAANPDIVIQIEREWADYLVSQGQNDAATMHYVESGDYSLALNCSLRAQQWNQAAEILRSAASTPSLRDELKLQYLRVGRHFAQVNDTETAEDLFLSVDAVKELIEMYLNLGRVDDALRRAKRQMKPAEMEQTFMDSAKKLEKKPQTRQIAEKIYIAIGRPNLAIEMYTEAGDSNSAMRLTSKYGGDATKMSAMAAKAERDGDLQTAENCYIKAGQWEKALFMYEQEKKWPDAMRIAKSRGDSTAEIKVAAHWATSLGGSAGVQRLQQLKLVEPVLFYACENGFADLATSIFNYCKTLSKNAHKEGHLKFAIFMESQNRFSDAESHYLEAEQPREAVEMYIHQKMWNDAQRLATRFNITDIPVNPTSSKKAGSNKATTGAGMNGLNLAIQYEQNGQYDEAIDTYLGLSADDCGGEEQLDQVLERAVKLTLTYRQSKLQDVVNSVAQVLLEASRHKSLGRILENIEAYPDAFEIYKIGQMWEDAARLVEYLDPAEQQQFQKEYQEYLQEHGHTQDLMGLGQVDKALGVYAKNGEWDTCLSLAQKEGPQYLEKYTMMYAQDLVNQQKYDEAVSILAKYQPSAESKNIPGYIALCQSTVYAVPTYDVIQPSFFALRQMLFKVVRNTPPNAYGFTKLENFTRAVHLLCQQSSCAKYGLFEQAKRASIAAVRYCDVVPADFLFYKAGLILEQAGIEDQAVVFYNSFVDVYDVIASGDISNSGSIDHQAFEQTDVPREVCLRAQPSVQEDTASRIRQWVLEKTMSGIDPSLPAAPCQKCGQQIYEASLKCPHCNAQFQFCSITGYPVINPTSCTACRCTANRADWGIYVSKTGRCPCCDAPQTAGA